MPFLELKNVNRIYRTNSGIVEALKNINIGIEDGSFTVILGKSGSGKSTLLNIIGMMDEPSSGEYYYNGEDTLKLSASQKAEFRLNKIGFIFQQFNLIYTMTAFENIELPLGYRGIKSDDRKKRVFEMLEFVGLSDRAGHKPQDMSGGEQQRIAVARALVGNPRVILADEPTGNLDKESADSLISLMLTLHGEYRQTMIIVTHDEKIACLADNVYRMDSGKITKVR